MNRFDIFYKNFKWVYVNFNKSYDLTNDPELFNDTVKAYYDVSKRLPTSEDEMYKFCRFVAQQEKWPLIVRWYDLVGEFTREAEPMTPQQKKTKKEQLEINLQNDIITGFWPLFGNLEDKVMVARIYAYTCFKNHLDLPDYWKQYLVYAPLMKLGADYFNRKPFTKKELRLMGMIIDAKNKDSKGRPLKTGKKLGQIVFGYFIPENKRKKY